MAQLGILEAVEIKEQLQQLISQALLELNLEAPGAIQLEHPANPAHGDYASNVALTLFAQQRPPAARSYRSPQELASQLVSLIKPNIDKIDEVAKVEAVAGFINFYLSDGFFIKQMNRVLEKKEDFGKGTLGQGKKVLLEHTSPDPIKTIHIGHLRNNFIGMTMARLLEAQGYRVVKDAVNNDRGTHVSRAIWGYLVFARKQAKIKIDDFVQLTVSEDKLQTLAEEADWRSLIGDWAQNPDNWLRPADLDLKSDHFALCVYALGSKALKLVPESSRSVQELLLAWEQADRQTRKLWRQIIDWSLRGYEQTYQRIGSQYDWVWHESDLYQAGKMLVKQGVRKGIFNQLEDGAVLSDLNDYGLSNTILLKSDGTALYHTFDLNLVKQKRKKFPSDRYIWDIGNDQILYLQQLFVMCEQLGIGRRQDYFHLNYGYIRLKGLGKMSSREGTILSADELMDEMAGRAKKIILASGTAREAMSQDGLADLAEKVALAALKYGLLKFDRIKDVEFDVELSLNLQGDSGPYLQYSYARARSILRKAVRARSLPRLPEKLSKQGGGLGARAEQPLLRLLYQLPEVVEEAATNYAPNLVCNYLFELAQRFNSFYEKERVIGHENQRRRLALTAAVAQILKNGLFLLGIEAPEHM